MNHRREHLKAWAHWQLKNPISPDSADMAMAVQELLEENELLKNELTEEAKINGMGTQRELKLLTERDNVQNALEKVCETLNDIQQGLIYDYSKTWKECIKRAENILTDHNILTARKKK